MLCRVTAFGNIFGLFPTRGGVSCLSSSTLSYLSFMTISLFVIVSVNSRVVFVSISIALLRETDNLNKKSFSRLL